MQGAGLRNERGMALVLAVVALVVISAIVAGTFFLSTVEQRTAYNVVRTTQAFEAAEAGLQSGIANWNPDWNALAAGTASAPVTATLGAATYEYSVARLNSQLFLLRSVGSQGGVTQTLASVVRLIVANPDVQAAVTAGHNVQVGGNATIDGRNTAPVGWVGCSPSADLAGIRSNGSVGTNGQPSIIGDPPYVANDTTVTDALFQTPFNQLRALASIELPGATGANNYITYTNIGPTTTGSPAVCDRNNTLNWGEPLRTGTYVAPCTSYAPIIFINGNGKVTNGRGQGILLVNGDFAIGGNFSFVGLVIATGEVKTGNGTSNVTGAIMAQNADIGDVTSFTGTPVVTYSRCALAYVLNTAARGRPLAGRSWAQVF